MITASSASAPTVPAAPTVRPDLTQAHAAPAARRKGRLMVDAPVRAFHWLFALSFTGAWITAESERWRDVHVTLGYAFGGLLLLRVLYGLIGPRQARLSTMLRRLSGFGDWLRGVRGGRLDLQRLATLAMPAAMVLLMAVTVPLVLSGWVSYAEWFGLEEAMEEVHEFFANSAMTLVLGHLALIGVLSVVRRKNLPQLMLSGRTPGVGPDLVKANRVWLAILVVAAYVAFIAWQLAGGSPV